MKYLPPDTKQIPASVQTLIKDHLHPDDANIVLQEMEESLKTSFKAPPSAFKEKSHGDWNFSFLDYTREERPETRMSYEVIEKMMESPPVRFAVEMKRASVMGIFRSHRSWKVHSPNEELAELIKNSLARVLPKMALDFSYSSLVYGASFQELVWEYKTAAELGMKKAPEDKKFIVPKVPNAINPATIKHIRRKKIDGVYEYDGFVQRSKIDGKDIIIERDASLLMPYNERFRKLWGESFLTPIYGIWFWYEVVMRSMVKYTERIGTPVTVVGAPSRGTIVKDDGTRVDALTWAMEIATNVSRSNAITIPTDVDENGNRMWTIEYMSMSEHSQPFMNILELLTQMILRAGLSADRALSQSSGGVGSYNIGEIHMKATASHNELILIQWLHFINRFFIPLYGHYNYGTKTPPAYLETQGLDPNDVDNMKTFLGVAPNIDSFKEASFLIDWDTMFTLNNVPLKDKEEAEEAKKKAEEEKLDAMKKQQEVVAANAGPMAPNGKPGFPGAKPAFGKPAVASPEKQAKKDAAAQKDVKAEEEFEYFELFESISEDRPKYAFIQDLTDNELALIMEIVVKPHIRLHDDVWIPEEEDEPTDNTETI